MFGRWWLSELGACAPSRLRSFFQRKHGLVVDIDDGSGSFFVQNGSDASPLGTVKFDVTSDEDERLGVQRLLGGTRLGSAGVEARLDRGRILRRVIELPAATLENLREVLRFEMDRHTPFKSDDACFDYRLLDKGADRKTIRVDLAVASRADVNDALARLERWGLRPTVLTVAGGGQSDWRPSFLPPAPHRSRWRAAATGLLGLAAVALLSLAVYLPLQQKRQELAGIQAELAEARSDALGTDELKARLATLADRGRYVVDRRRNWLAGVQLLDEVTRLLPDDTWVFQLGRRGNRLSISGYTESPAALIRLLEQSRFLREVGFGSPVMADPAIGGHRFNISAVIAEGIAP
ncbi:MAG: PilN domain-containing protein [Minwuiales bacterium]|nr:PilN domain-containing protein [Minwuiales bacterium]